MAKAAYSSHIKFQLLSATFTDKQQIRYIGKLTDFNFFKQLSFNIESDTPA